MRWNLLLICLLSVLLLAQADEEKKEEKKEWKPKKLSKEERAKLPVAHPPPDSNKTRSLHFRYVFKSETVLYDVLDHKVDSPSSFVEANLTFDMLHYGEDALIGKWAVETCISGNCGETPAVYVSFNHGGNNLYGVYIDPKEAGEHYEPRWNLLYAIVHTIYTPADEGAGDEQFVKTPYGFCQVDFSRPQDKRFRRQINYCQLAGNVNHTAIEGLLVTSYTQDVSYLQNTRVDADIVVIDTVEALGISSPFDEGMSLNVETRSRVEMHLREASIIESICEQKQTSPDCLLKKLGYIKVGDRLYEHVQLDQHYKDDIHKKRFSSVLQRLRDIASATELSDEHAKAFQELVQISVILKSSYPSSIELLLKALEDEDNYFIRETLVTVLGTLGGNEAVEAAQEVVFADGAALNRFEQNYLFGLANHIHGEDDKFNKKLMYWLIAIGKDVKEGKAPASRFWAVATTIATILRKDCERTAATHSACKTGKRQIVTKLVSEVSELCDSEECKEKALEVLLNLPLHGSVVLAAAQLCTPTTTSAVQLRALQVLERATPELYTSELIGPVVRVFRNTCPQPATTAESMAALDVLLKSIPDQHSATYILRTESVAAPADRELWAYLYDAVARSRLFDGAKDEFWARLRAFRLFRPNYAQRAIQAQSTAFGRDIAEFSGFRGRLRTSSEFGSGVFKSSQVRLGAIKGRSPRAQEQPLFELVVESSGLENYMDNEQSPLEIISPKGSVRVSLLGHTLPSITVFNGHQEMITAAMSANGQSIRAFEGAAALRAHSAVYPLLSGLSVSFESAATTVARFSGSAELSLWNRDSTTIVNVETSTTLRASAKTILAGKVLHSLDADLSLVTAVKSVTDAHFVAKPYTFCVNMGNSDAIVSLNTEYISYEGNKTPKVDKRSKNRVIPGESWWLGKSATKQCRLWLEDKQEMH